MVFYLSNELYLALYTTNIVITFTMVIAAIYLLKRFQNNHNSEVSIHLHLFWIFLFIFVIFNFFGAVVTVTTKALVIENFAFLYLLSIDTWHISYLLILINTGILVTRVVKQIRRGQLDVKYNRGYLYFIVFIPILTSIFYTSIKATLLATPDVFSARFVYISTLIGITGKLYNLIVYFFVAAWLTWLFKRLIVEMAKNETMKEKHLDIIRNWELFIVLMVSFSAICTVLAILSFLDQFLKWNYLRYYGEILDNGQTPIERVDLVNTCLKYLAGLILLGFSPVTRGSNERGKNKAKDERSYKSFGSFKTNSSRKNEKKI